MKTANFRSMTHQLVFLRDGLLLDSTKLHDACVVDRFAPKTVKADHETTSGLMIATYLLIGLICVISGFKQRINWLKSCYMTAISLAGYCFLVFLKEYLADTTCNELKANSVSGHFFFYTFHMLTLPYIWRTSLWPIDSEAPSSDAEEVPHKPIIMFGLRTSYFAFILVGLWTLYRTVAYGYHSLGQCLNGILFGLMLHFACLILTKKLDFPTAEQIAVSRRRRPTIDPVHADIPLIAFGIFNFTAFCLSYHYHGRIPLDTWELFLNVLVWARILWGP